MEARRSLSSAVKKGKTFPQISAVMFVVSAGEPKNNKKKKNAVEYTTWILSLVYSYIRVNKEALRKQKHL